MLRTIEATIDEHGHVTLAEPLTLPAVRRAIVVILNDAPESSPNDHQPTDTAPEETTPGQEERRPRFGSAKGQVWMAEDFDEPLEDFKEYM